MTNRGDSAEPSATVFEDRPFRPWTVDFGFIGVIGFRGVYRVYRVYRV